MAGVSWLRALAASVVLTLGASLVSVTALVEPGFTAPSKVTVPAAEDPGPQAPADEVAAMQQAHRTGQRVEIVSRRSETSQAFAEPDGTVTLESTPRPARVHRSDDSWAAVDTSLLRDANGAVVPRSTSAGLVFSAGGSGPMATVSASGKSLSLTWPNALPAPTLDGSTAVYADVLPGVDLRLTAEVDGFGEVLVVKTREAADNPDLTTLRMGVAGDGVTVSVNESGQLSAVDGAGATVFGAPTALMWDSSDPTTPASNVTAHAAGPGMAARQSTVDTTLAADGSSLTLVPDPAVLSDPATVYPVYVDPDVSTSIYTWTYVDSQYPSQAYMSDKGRTDAPAGKYEGANGGYYYQRSYIRFKFNLTSWGTARVTKSEFRVYSHYQWNSSPTDHPLHAYSTSAPDTSTTWNNQPTIYHDMGEHNVKVGEWVGFDAKDAVQQAADNDWLHLAFRLSSGDEGNVQARETYSMSGSTQPVLAVTMDHRPNKPTGLKISPCYTACASPAVTSSLQAKLTATVSDPDGDNLKHVDFEVLASDKTTRVAYTSTAVTNIKSGALASWTQNTARANNTTYYWHVRACDAWWCSDWSSTLFQFRTDNDNPSAPDVTCQKQDPSDPASTCVYPKVLAGQPEVYGGGVGIAGTFTFSNSDAHDFRWSLVTDALDHTVTAQNGVATLQIAPTAAGIQDLFVQAVDTAGNLGEEVSYRFAVHAVQGDVGAWTMDDASGTTAPDSGSPGGHDLTTTGGVTWQPGHVGAQAAGLDGTTGYLSTDVSVLDTTRSFTITAWAYLEADTGFQTLVSQDGEHSSSFYLQYRTQKAECGGCWAFVMRDHDTDTDVVHGAWPDPANPPANLVAPSFEEWTFLAGVAVVNADGTRELRLYVNGELQATTTLPKDQTFGSAGPLRVGRALSRSVAADFWGGQIDDVTVHQKVLPGIDIKQMYTAGEPNDTAPAGVGG